MDLEQAYRDLNVTSREDLLFKLKELVIRACEIRDVRTEDVPTDVPFIGGPGPLGSRAPCARQNPAPRSQRSNRSLLSLSLRRVPHPV